MSIIIEENVTLAPFTTMRIGGPASFFVRVASIGDLQEAFLWAQERGTPAFILGGGSNMLVPDDGFPGLVIKIELKGVIYEEIGGRVHVSVCAGEVWDEVVQGAVARGLWGIENLSLIPGTVGGAVVQNIGAYGVEICDAIVSVEAFDTNTMSVKTFTKDECAFGYRESIFKNNNLIVTSVVFDLTHNGTPRAEYEDVKKYFSERKIETPTLANIRDAVVTIRNAKMPAPPLGTAGSFFKNPVVSVCEFERLKKEFPGIKAYPVSVSTVKLSAGWLIDKVGGFRGFRDGDAGVYERQSLILVNYGNAKEADIISLARKMKESIKEKTNVILEEEVVMMRT